MHADAKKAPVIDAFVASIFSKFYASIAHICASIAIGGFKDRFTMQPHPQIPTTKNIGLTTCQWQGHSES